MRIVDSMFNQHAKLLKAAGHIAWRRPVASLKYLLSSHVRRQDHNGLSHQDPGFIDHVLNKKTEIVWVYLPPGATDANYLLAVTADCLRSRNCINVIVAGKHPSPQWLGIAAAESHCRAGIGTREWASRGGADPELVMACAGDVPTIEMMAAVQLLREHFSGLRVRVVNVVDLTRLQSADAHPHGMGDAEFDALFTCNRPVIFAFHGYPTLIHRLTYRRANFANFHVHGFREEGTPTTPFDMVVLNGLNRYRLFGAAVERLPQLSNHVEDVRRFIAAKLRAHRAWIVEHGDDLPGVRDWRWRAP